MIKLKKPFYTTEEAKKLLGLAHKNIVSNYINHGLLTAEKVSGIWLITKSSLQDKLKRQAQIDENIKNYKED